MHINPRLSLQTVVLCGATSGDVIGLPRKYTVRVVLCLPACGSSRHHGAGGGLGDAHHGSAGDRVPACVSVEYLQLRSWGWLWGGS